VRCRDCRTVYDVAERREWLLHSAEDVLATAPVISRALTRMGSEVMPDRIRQWASVSGGGRRLVRRGRDRSGVPLYRLGDVMDLLAAEARRQAELGAAREAKAAAKAERKAS
jgi:hypothetical protein